jgi:hypothetical protein
MTMEARSADGAIHKFPDGTPVETINKAMKNYALQQGATERIAKEREGYGPEGAWYQKLDDSARAFASGIPLIGGAMDEISAGANTGFGYLGDYEKELAYQRARDADFSTRHPVASFANQVAGGTAALAPFAKAIPPLSGSLLSKSAKAGAIGGAMGLEEGFTRGVDGVKNRMKEAGKSGLLGAGIGAAIPGVGALLGNAVNKFTGAAPAPLQSADDIGRASRQQYMQAESYGVHLDPKTYGDMVDDISATVFKPGSLTPQMKRITERQYGGTASLINDLQDLKGNVIPLDQIDEIRKAASNIADDVNQLGKQTPDALMASRVIDKIDEYVDNLPDILQKNMPDSIPVADATAARDSLLKARELWRQKIQASLIERAMERAEVKAGANYSQSGLHQALINEFKSLRLSKNFRKQFSPEQQEAIDLVVKGGPVQNVFRYFGKMAPSGGLSQMMNLGAAFQSGGLTVPISAAASASQYGAMRSGLNKAKAVEDLIKKGGPLLGMVSPQAKLASGLLTHLLTPQAGTIGANNRSLLGGR